MSRLSTPVEQLKEHYTVAVIGSGYGGGIAASRMARAGQSVCILERGKEFRPGEYPDTEPEAMSEMQIDTPEGHAGPITGLYDFHVNPAINAFVGCGLGGTSLVNANVALEAEPRVFDDHWPAAFRADLDTLVADGYQRAREMLKPTPYPDTYPPLAKTAALQASAASMGKDFYKPPINVTFEDPVGGVNHVGVEQHKCTMCGDCVTGCNYGAKNTTLMNYLPDAYNFGAEIFTQVSVRYLERKGNVWVIYYQVAGLGREKFDAPLQFLTADIVVLAAGTLGSTEVLLRSKANGLALSDQIGMGFTGNGDVLAFSYNGDKPIHGIGYGHRAPGEVPPVGPCITGIIDIRRQEVLNQGMVVEEGSIPGAIGALMPLALSSAAKADGTLTDRSLQTTVRQAKAELDSLILGPYHGAVDETQTYLVMTHDDSDGRMYLEKDRLRIDWNSVGKEPIFQKVSDTLRACTVPLDGVYTVDPLWSKIFNKSLVTVHPLGGCRMADDAAFGVVNHKGQVFSSNNGAAVYDGLYVADGSVMPRSLGVNPLLTISAVAERTAALLAKDRGWTIDYSLPSKPTAAPAVLKPGIRFTETMRGYLGVGSTGDYQAAADAGQQKGSPLEFTLTVVSEDVADMLVNPEHRAGMSGTVIAPALSASPLAVSNAVFQLFVKNPANVETTHMVYNMTLTSEEGRTYTFNGYKIVHPNPVWDSWHDTSTLYITVYDGASDASPALGKGVLHIEPADFARQMTTMTVVNAASNEERLKTLAAFGKFFAGTMYEAYGGIFAKQTVFNPDAPPRKKRPLRVGAPEVYAFPAKDDVPLRLTRYQGGPKGPVILSHGLGVSSLIFSIDTIDTNLLEYLYAHGYDVWLLDFRDSIDLPASNTQSTGDDVATKDYPAAVNKVREVTGAKDVQMVVHCWGSTTFFMAMLAGLEGVRSAVCSQIATHVVAPTLNKIRTGLHLPEFLDKLGIKSLTADVDTHAHWWSKLYDEGVDAYAELLKDRCDNPVCHRITFMYAPLYEHAQLNDATHDALHEMFGVANISSFEQIALCTRKGHIVAADGAEAYLPHLERLAIPLCFIHGGSNECFLPESTEITYNLLREKNGNDLYTRHVIPGYGHIDCIYGRDASRDIYPLMLEHLEATAAQK
jgi:cholesterol oxidase